MPPAVLATIAARDEYIRASRRRWTSTSRSRARPSRKRRSTSSTSPITTSSTASSTRRRSASTRCTRSSAARRRSATAPGSASRTMANLENNVEETRRLAEAALTKSCALTDEQKITEADTSRTIQIAAGYYIDACKAYEKAEKMPDGPSAGQGVARGGGALQGRAREGPRARRGARGRDERRLRVQAGRRVRPGHRDVPLFIKEYGNEENLAEAREGRPARSRRSRRPEQYGERVSST